MPTQRHVHSSPRFWFAPLDDSSSFLAVWGFCRNQQWVESFNISIHSTKLNHHSSRVYSLSTFLLKWVLVPTSIESDWGGWNCWTSGSGAERSTVQLSSCLPPKQTITSFWSSIFNLQLFLPPPSFRSISDLPFAFFFPPHITSFNFSHMVLLPL